MPLLKYYDTVTSQWLPILAGAKGETGDTGPIGPQGPAGLGSVAVTSPITNSGTSTAANLGINYSALQYGQNLIINGAFDFWQRGTSFTVNDAYTADRWFFQSYGTGTSPSITRTTSVPAGFEYSASIRSTNTTNSNFNYITPLETGSVIPLRGSTVTLSFFYRIPVSFSGAWSPLIIWSTANNTRLNPGNGTTIAAPALTNTSSWTRHTVTFVVPATASSLSLGIQTYNSTINNAEIQITGVQFELGSVATPFKRNASSIQAELAACQRYYYTWQSSSASMGMTIDFTWYSQPFSFPVEMRVSPSASVNATPTTLYGNNIGYGVSSFTVGTSSGTEFGKRTWQFYAGISSRPSSFSWPLCTFQTHGANFNAEL
jgi:hypothetical protein